MGFCLGCLRFLGCLVFHSLVITELVTAHYTALYAHCTSSWGGFSMTQLVWTLHLVKVYRESIHFLIHHSNYLLPIQFPLCPTLSQQIKRMELEFQLEFAALVFPNNTKKRAHFAQFFSKFKEVCLSKFNGDKGSPAGYWLYCPDFDSHLFCY